MKQSELESLPIATEVMFGSEVVWDEHGEKWWIGVIDGKAHRRPFGPQFFTASFDVSKAGVVRRVTIPYTGDYSDRLEEAARKWGAREFGCEPLEIEVSASL